jgi:hypothetical protein
LLKASLDDTPEADRCAILIGHHPIIESVENEIANIDNLVAEAECAIGLLQERRTALISAAVTGKIDVRGLVETEAA